MPTSSYLPFESGPRGEPAIVVFPTVPVRVSPGIWGRDRVVDAKMASRSVVRSMLAIWSLRSWNDASMDTVWEVRAEEGAVSKKAG